LSPQPQPAGLSSSKQLSNASSYPAATAGIACIANLREYLITQSPLSNASCVNTARNLSHRGGPSEHRSGRMEQPVKVGGAAEKTRIKITRRT
jgi:hypothetical protein